MADIAFLGLGAMGARMARRLLDAGHQLTVWNRSAAAIAPLSQNGARAVSTPREAVAGAEFVISMIRDDAASRAVWLDPDTGALEGLQDGATAIESSTLSVAWARELASMFDSQGADFLDAPVAGTLPQAEAGALVYFVGGHATVFSRAEPILKAMGAAAHHVGPNGNGAIVKLAVNAMLCVQTVMMSELIQLGLGAGMSAGALIEILEKTPLCSPAAARSAADILNQEYSPKFPVALAAKDMRYFLAAQDSSQLPLGTVVRDLFEAAIKAGVGDENINAVAKLYPVRA